MAETADEKIARLERENETLKASADSAAGKVTSLALETENARLRSELETVQAKSARQHAEAVVAEAVKSGKIPAKNEILRAKWIEQIVADPDAAELLKAMEASAVISTIIKDGGATRSRRPQIPNAEEHSYCAKAKELAKQDRIPLADAYAVLAKTEPQLYEEYCEDLGREA